MITHERNPISRLSHTIRLWMLLALSLGLPCYAGCHAIECGQHCSIPSTYSDEFAPPAQFGYFPTLWHTWPGEEFQAIPNERVPESRKGREELPPPSNVPDMGQEGLEPQVPDRGPELDQIPEGLEPALPREGGTLPTPFPRLRPNQPAEEPEAPAPDNAPKREPEPKALPEDLFEGITPSAPMPPMPQSSLNIDTLPNEAPSGSLVPEELETAEEPSRPPALLRKEGHPHRGSWQPKQIETALRPRAESEHPKEYQLPASNNSSAESNQPAEGPALSPLRPQPQEPVRRVQGTEEDLNSSGWRAKGAQTSSKITTPQRQSENVAKRDYSARQASYTASESPSPSARKLSNSANPLR